SLGPQLRAVVPRARRPPGHRVVGARRRHARSVVIAGPVRIDKVEVVDLDLIAEHRVDALARLAITIAGRPITIAWIAVPVAAGTVLRRASLAEALEVGRPTRTPTSAATSEQDCK